MDPSQKARIPARAYISYEKYIYYKKKDEFATQGRPLEQAKTSKASSSTAQNAKLNIPVPRHRILSDTALLPPTKKVRIAVPRPKDHAVTRVPLRDLDRNVANKNVAVPESDVKKNVRIVKTLTFRKVDAATTHCRKKVEEFAEYRKATNTNTKHVYERNTYRSKSTRLASKVYQPTTISNFQTSEPDLNKAFIVNKTNICDHKDLNLHPKIFISKDDSYIDETVIASAEYGSHNENKSISPIVPNPYAAKSVLTLQGISEETRRSAKKTQSESRQRTSTAYCLDIYNTEYLDDIVRNQLRNDWKYVLTINLLKISYPCCKQTRVAVVNWLIRAQEYLNLSPTVLFTTIRLFDRVLETIAIPCNMCQLVGLVVMWIVTKLEDIVNCPTVSKMILLCRGVYLKQDFLKMERKILALFNFDLHIPDVTVYIVFYIKKLQIEHDLLLHSAFYILECYALNVQFSTVPPSVQAASAVCLALKMLSPASQIWQHLKNAIGYYTKEELHYIMQEMLQQLHVIQDTAYEYRAPYKKYAEKAKLEVSIVLQHKLNGIIL